jgi:MFS family permease
MACRPPVMSQSAPIGWRLLRLRDFRLFIFGRFLASGGQHIQTVGVGLYIYELTRDPLALGLAGLITFLPQILLVAAGGYAADSFDRRVITALTYAANALSAALLLAIVIFDIRSIALIYGAVAIIGASRAFGMPASQALAPNLVPLASLPSAIAWSASTVQSATIIGPTIGGLLYVVGPRAVFATAMVVQALGALAIMLIATRIRPAERVSFSVESFMAGLRFITSRKALLGAVSLDLVAVMFAGVGALLPIFATDILDAGPAGVGLLRGSQAAGALCMALFLAQVQIRSRAGFWMLLCVCVYGAAIIGFGLSKTLWLSMLFMAIEGAADMVSVVVRLSIVQRETPEEMRGRVAAVNGLFIGGSNSLGEFEAGVAARLIGVVPATIFGGAMAIATALLWAKLFPELRRMQKLTA